MKKIVTLFSVVLFTSFLFSACGKDDPVEETPVDKHTMILEKTWYNNPNKGRGDHFFGSDGTLQITNPTWSGTYVWGPNDSLTVLTTGGATVNWWFKSITETQFEYWPTNEDPNNIYTFTLTQP